MSAWNAHSTRLPAVLFQGSNNAGLCLGSPAFAPQAAVGSVACSLRPSPPLSAPPHNRRQRKRPLHLFLFLPRHPAPTAALRCPRLPTLPVPLCSALLTAVLPCTRARAHTHTRNQLTTRMVADFPRKGKNIYMFNLNAIENLSPFELKNELINIATTSSERVLTDAGRGNPNWIAVRPRLMFNHFGLFAMGECDSVSGDLALIPSFLGNETPGVITRSSDRYYQRYQRFLQANPQAAEILRPVTEYAEAIDESELLADKGVSRFTRNEFIYELCISYLGCQYMYPDRIMKYSEQILKQYLRSILKFSQDFDVYAVEGGTAGMTYVFKSLKIHKILKDKDNIIIVSPVFSPYLEIPYIENLTLVNVKIDDRHFLDETLPHELTEAVKVAKVICIVNPGNPTSLSMSRKQLEQLRDIVETHNPNLLIISDDVYATFVEDFTCVANVLPRNTITIYSFSKFIGVTGWRLGAVCISKDNVMDECLNTRRSCTTTPYITDQTYLKEKYAKRGGVAGATSAVAQVSLGAAGAAGQPSSSPSTSSLSPVGSGAGSGAGLAGLEAKVTFAKQDKGLEGVLKHVDSILTHNEVEQSDAIYKDLTNRPASMNFIERIVADSRLVALHHTAGLSAPQQLFIVMSCLYLLKHGDEYKQQVMSILHERLRNIYEAMSLPIPRKHSFDRFTFYYLTINIEELITQYSALHGLPGVSTAKLFKFITDNYSSLDICYKLARDFHVIALPGRGFGSDPWSIRISLANCSTEQYKTIGRSVKAVVFSYVEMMVLSSKLLAGKDHDK